MSKKSLQIIISFCILLSISSCSHNGSNNNEPTREVIETITISNESRIYTAPNLSAQILGELKIGESIDIYKKIEEEDVIWYQIDNDKWIKEDKNESLTSANNWEEMALIISQGYWLLLSDTQVGYLPFVELVKFNTINFGNDIDKKAHCIEDNQKGLCFEEYTESKYKENGTIRIGSFIFVSDDTNNKIVTLSEYSCSSGGRLMQLDYSKLKQNMLLADVTVYNIESPEQFETYTFYYYPTLETGLVAKEENALGEVEILANVVNIRPTPKVYAGDEPIGKVEKGQKYKVYQIINNGFEPYIWYEIGPGQYIADDGTWLTFTPNE